MSRRLPNTTAADIEAVASDWVVRRDAGLTAAEQGEFETWRDADPRHAAAVAWHEQIWATFDRPRRAGKGRGMLEKFAASTRRRQHRRLGTLAGAFVLLLSSVLVWRARAPLAPAAVIAANAVVVVPEKQTLPDGSVVELRNGAKIAVRFDAATRRVILQEGEAHFHVAKHQPRPFVVVARGVEVHAVGTAFSVEMGPGQIDVLVTEGLVNVISPVREPARDRGESAAPAFSAATVSTRSTPLGANQRISVPLEIRPTNTSPEVLAVTEGELAERLAWRSTRLEFTDTPLGEAIALMNQHATDASKLRIVIDDADLARAPVTGLFRADNSETFVHLLEASLSLKAERSGDAITLRKAR